jgi:hypothetical protein
MDAFGLVTTLIRQPLHIIRYAVRAAESVYKALTSGPPEPEAEPRRPEPAPAGPRERATRAPSPVVPPEAKVLNDDPILVEVFAERGAEEPAGPEIRVDEPFEGYSLLKANDVIDRLRAASAEEAAAIELYEGTTKGRATVMRAAQTRLAELDPRPAR